VLGSTAGVHTVADASHTVDALFWLTFESAPIGMALIALDGRIGYANPELCSILGYTKAELSSRTFRDVTYLDDLPDTDEFYIRVRMGETANNSLENRHVRKGGEVIKTHIVVSVVRDSAGTPLHYISMITDLTSGRGVKGELEQVHTRYRVILDNVDDCLILTDAAGVITFVSRPCTKLVGWAPDELVGKSLYKYIYPDERDAVKTTFEHFLTGSDKRIHIRFRAQNKDSEWAWVDSYTWAIPGPSGARHEMGVILRDTSEYQREQTAFVEEIEQAHARRQAEEEVALTDQLTGLRNRRAADDVLLAKLTGVRASAFPVGCLLIAIDNFGLLVGRYGQATGDAVLKQIAALVTASCRHDDFIARYSDDQFLVVLPGTNPGGTIICGEKLLRNVRGADWSATPLKEAATVSIGASCVQFGSGLTLPELVGILDLQLQQARDNGGDRIVMNTRQITGKPQF
jgi:diguanylate cyclase (GGDEF)-like protein/PAS domain S-box-containing protein